MTAGNRMISSTFWTTGWLALMGSLALGQSVPTLSEQQQRAEDLELRLPVPTLTPKQSFDLSPARQEHLQKFLPQTFRKLSQRETLHILVLGDASALQIQEGAMSATFPGVFAKQLADQFYYPGGVQESGQVLATGVPTLILRSLAQADGSVLDAASILQSSGRQTPVDVVLICYGQNDAAMQPPTFSRAIGAAIAGARELGAEVILCSPWLRVAERSEAVLGLTRPLADAQQELAKELGVLHSDLGDLSRLLAIPSPQNQDEGQVFERIEKAYREYFYLEASGSFTPRPSLHRQLGALVYKDLLEPRTSLPWQISSATATETAEGQMTLTYRLKNISEKDLALTALPLIANGWKPVEAKSTQAVKPGATQPLTVTYVAEGTPPALQEALVRQPVLICTDTVARVETIRAGMSPVSIVWGLETLFNQEAAFLAGCQLVNPGKETVKGSWEAEFGSKVLKGDFDLRSASTTPLNLRFDLPKDGPALATVPLKLTVKTGDKTLTSTRNVTLTRNLGLNQSVRLTPAPDKNAKAAPPAVVTFTPKADAKGLILVFDLPEGDLLQESADGSSPSWQVELNLDARSYGKRLEPGSTATVRATGKATDGPGKVHPIPAWAFGNGYGASFDPKAFKAALTSSAGKRQISFSIPRTYLYLHEWALENGNSQVGIAVRLTLRGSEGYVTYHLPLTSKPRNDIESLIVLELAAQPTGRVTVNVE